MYHLGTDHRLQEPETYVREGILASPEHCTDINNQEESCHTYIGGTVAWCWAQVLRPDTCAPPQLTLEF